MVEDAIPILADFVHFHEFALMVPPPGSWCEVLSCNKIKVLHF